jgi:phosphoglucomutase
VSKIKFGTSGWRAIISEDFTFANVRLVVQAIADYINKVKKAPLDCARGKKGKTVVVGYDTRFLSKEFAHEAAKVLSANKIKVLLCDRDTPTPVIAYHIIDKKCAGGINFTASHNPPHYNGIKFSPSTGGPATPDITSTIEQNIEKLQKSSKSFNAGPNEKLIERFDPMPGYLEKIISIVNMDAIKKAKLKIACDCLYGTSRGYLDRLLLEHGLKPIVLHGYLNPYFGGKRPEPAPENIKELIKIVKKDKLHLGLATDGDADRFGIVDSNGAYITPNEVIVLLLYHFIKNRKSGKKAVARTVATTHMIDRIAKRHDLQVLETPVGFKYFVESILSGDCIIAGEESGGLSISGHVPEKDGILACLLIAELRAIEKKPISDILSSIYKVYGKLYSDRIDLELTEDKKNKLMKKLLSGRLGKFAGHNILKRDTKDGVRFFLGDDAWLLFRASGTEPIVRIYFESTSKKSLKAIERAVRCLV